jgi:hypothetical protein
MEALAPWRLYGPGFLIGHGQEERKPMVVGLQCHPVLIIYDREYCKVHNWGHRGIVFFFFF